MRTLRGCCSRVPETLKATEARDASVLGAAEELATIVAAALGWLQQRHDLAAGRAALSRFEAEFPTLLVRAEAALAAVEAQGGDDKELGWEEADERQAALEASVQQVDGLGARWRDRAAERTSHAATAALLEAKTAPARALTWPQPLKTPHVLNNQTLTPTLLPQPKLGGDRPAASSFRPAGERGRTCARRRQGAARWLR